MNRTRANAALALALAAFAAGCASPRPVPLSFSGGCLTWSEGGERRVAWLDSRRAPGPGAEEPHPQDLLSCAPRPPEGILAVAGAPGRYALWLLDAGHWRVLTHTDDLVTAVAARPGSTEVCYVTSRGAWAELWYLDAAAESPEPVCLTRDPAVEDLLSFSADGRSGLLVRHQPDGRDDLVLVDWPRRRLVPLVEGRRGVSLARIAPDGREACWLDAEGLWRVRWVAAGKVEPRERLDTMQDLRRGVTALTLGRWPVPRISTLDWWGDWPVVSMDGAAIWVLPGGEQWRRLRGSAYLCERAGAPWVLSGLEDGRLAAFTLIGERGRRTPLLAVWRRRDRLPTVVLPGTPPASATAFREGLAASDRERAEDRRALRRVEGHLQAKRWKDAEGWAKQVLERGDEASLVELARRLGRRDGGAREAAARLEADVCRRLAGQEGTGPWNEPPTRAEAMARFASGARTSAGIPAATTGSDLAALRVRVGVLDALGGHDGATALALGVLGQLAYKPGNVLDAGLVDWLAAAPEGVISRARLGHLPAWLDARLQAALASLEQRGASAVRDAAVVAMISSWDGTLVKLIRAQAASERDEALFVASSLLLSTWHEARGEIAPALEYYAEAAELAGDDVSRAAARAFEAAGPMDRHLAWRWLEAERRAGTGPWGAAEDLRARIDLLRRMPTRLGPYARRVERGMPLGSEAGRAMRPWLEAADRYRGTLAADAARLRLAGAGGGLPGTEWLLAIVTDAPDSALWDLALSRLVGTAKAEGTCARTAWRLKAVSERWSHRARREALLAAAAELEGALREPEVKAPIADRRRSPVRAGRTPRRS
jgi:hypothetical protein